MKRKLIICLSLIWGILLTAQAQYCIGTTGLLHLPTADMQPDKTLMVGGGWLNKAATPDCWYYDTPNYYVNITFLEFFEISYDCTLWSGDWIAKAYGISRTSVKKWANQDRNFSARLRVLKEGQFWKWMPQVVVGANDVLHTSSQEDSGKIGVSSTKNGHWGRWYMAFTKHLSFPGIGTLGAHVAGMYNDRKEFLYKGVGVGADFKLDLAPGMLPDWLTAAANTLDVMAEYDTRAVNVGLRSSVWKDRVSVIGELYECKHASVGVQFKVTLK